MMYHHYKSKYNISNLGTNIALIGATGDGKTTTAAGITNYLIEIIIDKCISRMDKIRKQLYFVNFNTIKNLYIQYLDLTNSFDFALIRQVFKNLQFTSLRIVTLYFDAMKT